MSITPCVWTDSFRLYNIQSLDASYKPEQTKTMAHKENNTALQLHSS